MIIRLKSVILSLLYYCQAASASGVQDATLVAPVEGAMDTQAHSPVQASAVAGVVLDSSQSRVEVAEKAKPLPLAARRA